MPIISQAASLLLLSFCCIFYIQDAKGVIRHDHSLPLGYYQPAVQHLRVRRQAAGPAPPPPSPLRDCPCSSNPCLNGGECSSQPGRVPNTVDFICICRGRWTGATCENCPSAPVCSQSCLAYRNNDVCNDGGPGSVDDKCSLGTDCNDCHSRCP